MLYIKNNLNGILELSGRKPEGVYSIHSEKPIKSNLDRLFAFQGYIGERQASSNISYSHLLRGTCQRCSEDGLISYRGHGKVQPKRLQKVLIWASVVRTTGLPTKELTKLL